MAPLDVSVCELYSGLARLFIVHANAFIASSDEADDTPKLLNQ